MDRKLLELLVSEHVGQRLPRLDRLWRYYRNPLAEAGEAGGYRLGQEAGLPDRLRAAEAGSSPAGEAARERVVENDIGWRVHTLVDFMFGRPVVVRSGAADRTRGRRIERFLQAVFEANGGVGFFQDLALLGAVYGYVDVLVRVDPERARRAGGDVEAAARAVRLETVDPPRAIPVMSEADYRELTGYAVHVRRRTNELAEPRWWRRVRRGGGELRRRVEERTQVWTAQAVREYVNPAAEQGPAAAEGGRALVSERVNRLGVIPVVHIQNLPQPFHYEGLSEVEALIPLQDELNTRLSDRANRVTLQSFKMYLGKGIEQFTDRPVGPGQMWATDNPEASIQEFGGDGANPSEEAHINEIREALDKTSGVTPVAAGLIRGRVGNLTSENALRIVLMGLLAKTEKKRVTYGAGIRQMCELALQAADVHGLLNTDPAEREVRLDWPSPLPDSEGQRLSNAQKKLDVGVPRERVLAELGYG